MRLYSKLLWRLRQEDYLNPGGGGYSEPRSCHYTPVWATQQDSISKKNNKKRNLWFPLCFWAQSKTHNTSTGLKRSCILGLVLSFSATVV